MFIVFIIFDECYFRIILYVIKVTISIVVLIFDVAIFFFLYEDDVGCCIFLFCLITKVTISIIVLIFDVASSSYLCPIITKVMMALDDEGWLLPSKNL